MSLTATDLQDIRTIMREEARGVMREEVPEIVRKEVSIQLGPVTGRLRDIDDRLMNVDGRLEAVENDVKEIYLMLAKPADING